MTMVLRVEGVGRLIQVEGTIHNGCIKTVYDNIYDNCNFAGGETFSMCFWSDSEGIQDFWCITYLYIINISDTPKRCLCSRQLCNSAVDVHSYFNTVVLVLGFNSFDEFT